MTAIPVPAKVPTLLSRDLFRVPHFSRVMAARTVARQQIIITAVTTRGQPPSPLFPPDSTAFTEGASSFGTAAAGGGPAGRAGAGASWTGLPKHLPSIYYFKNSKTAVFQMTHW